MAKRQPKIKRYRKIYGGRSTLSKVMSVFLTVLLLVGVACLGWTLYEPVSRWLSGVPTAQDETASSRPAASIEVSLMLPPLPEVEIENPNEIRGAYLPSEKLADETQLRQALQELREQGFNAVLIDAKDQNGMVRYLTADQNASIAGAQAEDAVDLKALVELAEDYRLSVIPRIYAFRDHTAGLVFTGWAVKYMDTEMLWLDDSKENGGRSWLNPCSEEAQMYVAELAVECAALGCEAIILDGIQFPEGYSLDLAGYGVPNVDKDQILSAFVQDMDELLKEKECQLIVSSSAVAMLGERTASCQSGALIYPVDSVSPDLRPSALAAAKPSGLAAEDPENQPAEAVAQSLELIREKAGEKAVLPILQGCGAGGTGYGAEQVKAQIEALEKNGVTGYILYSENGNYRFE